MWIAWLAAFSIGLFSSLVRAADERTIEAARKEGAVSFYTTMAATESKLFVDGFQNKYPFLKVEITRLGSEKLLQRILTENRAGRGLFDATSNSGFEMHLLNKTHLLARYQ
jgi:iron(III) transport system substrate-binding protein